MDNKLSYEKNSGFGENTKLEMDVIRNYFGERLISIEEIKDKERQVQGIDYIVKTYDYKGEEKTLNIDTKIHHYNSELFVFEFDDDRPNYRNRTWGTSEKKTDLLIWIIPGLNEYFVYTEKSLKEFRNSMNWNFFSHEPFMDVKHFDYNKNYLGKTYNKWLPTNFTIKCGFRYSKRHFEMNGKYKCYIKDSKFYYNELTQTFSSR